MPESDASVPPQAPPTATPEHALAALVDGERKRLPLAHVAAETCAWWIGVASTCGSLLVVLIFGLALGWFPGWLDLLLSSVWMLITATLCVLARAWPRWEHRHTAYAVHESGLDIWRGIVWRRVISVPRSRVQHTDVEQGPLQRKFGVATLIVHTAGTGEARVALAGLTRETALEIRDFLIRDATRDPEQGDAA
jgi:membrane protein YdbS with pleckstrin-like domain